MQIPFTKPTFSLLDYQAEDLPTILNTPRCLVAYSTGLGKAIIELACAAYIKSRKADYPVFIFTKASLLKQLIVEHKLNFDTDTFPLTLINSDPVQGKDYRIKLWQDYIQNKKGICLVSYDILYTDFYKIKNLIKGLGTYCVFLDEISVAKNKSSKLNRILSAFCMYATRVVGLDATPISEALDDLYGVFRVIKPDIFKDFESFASDYLIQKEIKPYIKITIGYRNLELLKLKIQPYIIRRLKTEVNIALPTFHEEHMFIEMTTQQKGGIEAFKHDPDLNPLTMLIRLQQISDYPEKFFGASAINPKFEVAEKLLYTLRHEKTLLFCQYLSIIDQIADRLSCKGVVFGRITGSESFSEREVFKDKFNDGDLNLILLTRAGMKGLNLHGASRLVFYDSVFSFGQQIQLIGRIHRLRSLHKDIYIHYLINKGSVDEYVHKILSKKSKLIQAIFEGKIDHPAYSDLKVRASDVLKAMGFKKPVNIQLADDSFEGADGTDSFKVEG